MCDIKCSCGATIYAHNANRGITKCFDCKEIGEMLDEVSRPSKADYWAEATEAFYQWEAEVGIDDYSDEDRLTWCEGFIYCKERYEQ